MTIDTTRTLATALCSMAAAAALVGCDRPEPRAAQPSDAPVVQMERKSVEPDARGTRNDSRQPGNVDPVANKVGDAAITTMINAELTRDSQLSALRVDVDTVDGRVTLRGDAPSTSARDRATLLAQRVDGVKSVDNQLNVKASG